MNNIEIIFFEEYKKLDNLCKDLLGSNQWNYAVCK